MILMSIDLQRNSRDVSAVIRSSPLVRKEIPVSVKTRLGVNEVVIEDWIETLLSESPSVITVHGRTLKQQYAGEADWDLIGKAATIVRKTETLLFGNGDIQSATMAVQRVKQSGVHGVLLGRITMGNPWIFTTRNGIRKAVQNGQAPPPDPSISLEQRLAVVLEHARLYEDMKGPRPYHSIRKFLASYFRGFPNVSLLHRELVRIESLSEVQSILVSFLRQEAKNPSKDRSPSNQNLCV